jgi:hypothetical protein
LSKESSRYPDSLGCDSIPLVLSPHESIAEEAMHLLLSVAMGVVVLLVFSLAKIA